MGRCIAAKTHWEVYTSLPLPWAGKLQFSGISIISLKGILNYSRCQGLRWWSTKKKPEKSKRVMLCPLYSANPKTRQESIYIWLIFPWPVSSDPRKYVVVPLHKLLCHFPSHHHHTVVYISFYLYESRNKSEFNYVLGISFLKQGREEGKVETLFTLGH